jgi:hypothetical protein
VIVPLTRGIDEHLAIKHRADRARDGLDVGVDEGSA